MLKGRKHLVYLTVLTMLLSMVFTGGGSAVFAANLVSASNTTTAVTIDGNMDSVWAGKVTNAITNVGIGSVANSSDLSGNFGVLWDNTNLYLMFDINDNIKNKDSAIISDDDSIDIFLDMNHNHGTSYGTDDFRYAIKYDGSAATEYQHNAMTGVSYAGVGRTGGYRVEVRIPWSTLGKTPSAAMTFGLEICINDDDNGGTRDKQMEWNDGTANAWSNPSLMGDCTLAGGVTVSGQIEGENYNSMSGIITSACSEGGNKIGSVDNNDWVRYDNVDLGTGYNTLEVRLAAAAGGVGTVEVRLDSLTGTLISTISPASTGSWTTWTTQIFSVSGGTGVHSLYFRALGGNGICDINWFKFSTTGGQPANSLSITSYGAVPNDSEDDLTAINNCIAAAKAQGKSVYVPAGTFNHSGPITLDSVDMIGAGNTLSVLNGTSLNNYTIWIKGNGTDVKDLKFTVSSTTERIHSAHRLWVQNATNWTINNVHIYRSTDTGIFNDGGVNGSITHTFVEATGADAIHNTGSCSYITVENCKVRDNGDDMIACVAYTGQDNHHLYFRNNDVANNHWGRGITVIGGHDIEISGNTINHSSGAGILLATETAYPGSNVYNITVSNNGVYDCGWNSGNHTGVMISGLGNNVGIDVNHVTFTGNTSQNNKNGNYLAEGDYADVTRTGNTGF